MSYTVNEAAAFTQLDPAQVYKERERGILVDDQLEFYDLVYLKLAVGERLFRSIAVRRNVRDLIRQASFKDWGDVELSSYVTLRVSAAADELQTRIAAFRAWKSLLRSNPRIMGGEVTFPGKRLTVRHVGELVRRGAAKELREDYPYLSAQDLELARLYVDAYPRRGRPAKRSAA